MVIDTARGSATRVEAPQAADTAAVAEQLQPDAKPAKSGVRFHRGSALVALIGVLITLVLSLGAAALNTRNEDRLLKQRAREIALVAENQTTSDQSTLQAGVIIAAATQGNAATFTGLANLVTGPEADDQYISASLWRLGKGTPAPIAVVGAQPNIGTESAAKLKEFFGRASSEQVSVVDLLDKNPRRLGYVITSPGDVPEYAIYAESLRNKGRKARIASDPAFSDLGYAIYLGTEPNESKLLASSAGHGITNREASSVAHFGDSKILITVAKHKQLGGTLLQRLPWILFVFGLVMTAGSTVLAERLIRRREAAEVLAFELDAVASENARLYNEQRSVARTLQHTLLPTALPRTGIELAARYVAGDVDVEIGGDWYDVIPLDNGRLLFVIGDVSGRGIPAASVMASLRYAVRAYAAQGDEPDVILTKLGRLLSIRDDGHFATVLCGRLDPANRRLDTANAGHLDPLLLTGREASFLKTRAGVPIGAMTAPTYRLITTELPRSGTLLLYTDGLIERRGESLDVGFARLARAAENEAGAPVEAMLAGVVNDLIPGGASDDTALLGLRWET